MINYTVRCQIRSLVRRIVVAFVVMLVLLLAAALFVPVQAQGRGEADIPAFDTFLVFMSSTGVTGVVAILLSFAVEYIKPYSDLAPKNKRLIYFALCLVVPILGAALRAGLGYTPLTFDPLIWHALWNGVAAGGIGTLVHTYNLPTADELARAEKYVAGLEAERAERFYDTVSVRSDRPPAL